MKIPFVSVIIPTLNREEILCQTIESVLKQDYPLFELIIVDQTEKHKKETEDFLEEHKKRIRYFKLKKKNASSARNFGLKKSNGEIIILLDDDTIPKRGFIAAHLRNYQNLEIQGVAGRIVDKVGPPAPYSFYAKVLKNGNYLYNYTLNKKMETETFSGGNCSFRKSILKKIGYFDENFIGNDLFGDIDLGFRMSRVGLKIIFEPKAEVFHLLAKKGGCRKEPKNEPRWYYEYFYNHSYFFFKNLNHFFFPLFLIQKKISWRWLKCITKGFTRWRKPLGGFFIPLKGIWDGFKKAREK
jgi:GT2 family glycosyltransferase